MTVAVNMKKRKFKLSIPMDTEITDTKNTSLLLKINVSLETIPLFDVDADTLRTMEIVISDANRRSADPLVGISFDRSKK